MSAESLRNIEKAVEAHYAEMVDSEPDTQRGMIVDWVVGWTVHGVVDVAGEGPVSAYANWWAGADTNPNGQAHLAHWVGDEIGNAIAGPDDD